MQKPNKSKNKAEKVPDEKSPIQPTQRKVRKISPPSREPSLSKEEVRKHSRSKVKNEQKAAREDSSPARPVKKKIRKSSRSPSLPSPQTPPPRSGIPNKQKPEREVKVALLSEEGLDAEAKNKTQSKESKKERGKDYKDRSPASDVKKSKGSQEEASNGAAAVPAKEEEEDDGFHEMKDPRIREKHSKQVETPQSPIVSTKSSRSSIHGNIESELSSGEDFKVETDWSSSRSKAAHKQKQVWSDKEKGGSQQKQERHEDGDNDVEKLPSLSLPHSPHPRTPEYPVDEPEWKEGVPHTPPSEEEEDDRGSSKGGMKAGRKTRKLPRRYQIEPGPEQGPGRREGARHREGGKDSRQERRHHAQPPSPSPPPHHQRKRYHHSPPPPAEGFDRRKRRGRAYSPGGGAGGGGYQQRRRHSRSPPYLGSPPPLYKAKSPYGGSPPHGYVSNWN